MTENEAIAHAREKAKEQRYYANFERNGMMYQSCIKCAEEHEQLSEWLEELNQYRAIGTPEECMAAAVKQTAKKPIFNHNLSDTLSVFHCECGNTIKVSHDIGIMNNNNAPNYCSNCGCRLDWSDEE